MAQNTILPFAKAIYLCDGCIGFPNQKTDIVALFNTIRAPIYPHTQKQFVVFAQLCGSLGKVPFYIDVRYAPTGDLIYTTGTNLLNFKNREQVVQLAYTIRDCPFPNPGQYVVELFCDAYWVADTTLKLH
jgi:hypothetical protein